MPDRYGDDSAVSKTIETFGIDLQVLSRKAQFFSIQENTLTSEEQYNGLGL